MSGENEAIVRSIYDHLNRSDIQAVADLCDDKVELDMTGRVFNPETYRGREGLERFYQDVTDAWESYVWGVEETRDAGDTVIAMLHCTGQSRAEGPGVDWRVAWAWRFSDGRPVAIKFYRDRAEALEAAGLSE